MGWIGHTRGGEGTVGEVGWIGHTRGGYCRRGGVDRTYQGRVLEERWGG